MINFTTITHFLAALIAPPFCASCKQWLRHYDAVICGRCRAAIKPVVSVSLALTKHYTLKVFALSAYQDPLKTLILAKTISDRIASKQLGQLLATMPFAYDAVDCFVPIPLHWTRYAYRGYNQAEVIASVLAQHSGKQLANILHRTKRTVLQSSLHADQRMDNVKQVFSLTIAPEQYAQYHNKHIVLVDDLMTTGATLQSAARELIKLKPASISAIVVCRVL